MFAKTAFAARVNGISTLSRLVTHIVACYLSSQCQLRTCLLRTSHTCVPRTSVHAILSDCSVVYVTLHGVYAVSDVVLAVVGPWH
jgi:hypothetical protein